MANPAAIRHDRIASLPANKDTHLPANRSKLRNLTSISLRNISLQIPTSPTARRRGKTIDDDALPHTLQSPAKLVALRERENDRAGLEHSRSSSDLRASSAIAETAIAEEEVDGEGVGGGVENGSPLKSKGHGRGSNASSRPRMPGRMRRRSTLEWAQSTPQRRQERLERALEERMVDCFFSVHVGGVEGMVWTLRLRGMGGLGGLMRSGRTDLCQ